MKRIKFISTAIAILIVTATISYADYSTPGNGVVWDLDSLVAYSGGGVTFSGGSYFLNDTVTISQSDTLRIYSNFTMKMSEGTFIDIFGVMQIDPPDSATITAADTALKFLGLKFEDQSDGSLLKDLIFEYGNGIRMLDCNILIDNCTVRFNTLNSSFSSSAISLFRSNSTISNCRIYRNRRSAISSGANIPSSPRILNNHIYENDTENANVPQINLGASNADTLLIKGNTITGLFDNSGGISLLPIGSIPIAVIDQNNIRHNRYGIAIGGGNSFVIIKRNYIDSNNIQGNPQLGGSGINFNGSSTQTSIVSHNYIRGNLWGITIQGTAKPNMGDLSNASPDDDGWNSIHDNGNSGMIFDLYNNTPDSIKAENNWWGTSIPDSIEAHIFHMPDSSSLGYVDFDPFLFPLSAGSNEMTTLPGSISLKVYPNPFNPSGNIEYILPERSEVMIRIYDLAGRLMNEIDNPKTNSGRNVFRINADGMSSGAYFFTISSGRHFAAGRFVVLK